MEERVIQSKTGRTINTNNASVKPWYMSCKNSKYLASITGGSVITCDEIIEERKTAQQILMKKKSPVKQKVSIFYLPFY